MQMLYSFAMTASPAEFSFEGKVLALRNSDEGIVGWVEFQGIRFRVNLSLLPGIHEGEKVMVCGRTAMSRANEPTKDE